MPRKTVLTFLILFCITGSFLFAFDWPLDDPVVVSTFGDSRAGSFGNGIEIRSLQNHVKPSEGGEILFYSDGGASGVLPSGLGDIVVIEHERKLRTLYEGLTPADAISSFGTVSTSDVIGFTAETAPAGGEGLYFSVIDSEFGQYVNPLLLLNSIIDNKAPVIEQVRIINGSGSMTVGRRAVAEAGEAEISVKLYDPCMSEDYDAETAPYKVQLFLNGEEIFYLNFESLSYDYQDAVIQSRSDMRYSDYYREDGFVSLSSLTLVPGESRFEILVSDYAENESAYTFSLTVVEPAE